LVTIKSLDPIEGKDRIVYAHFEENGYGVICSKDFQIGEKAVYFEVDSILPELPEYESFRARCYRPSLNGFLIKNMKMFKLYSNGLIMHQNEVPLIKEQKTVADLGGIAKRGDLTELTGVKKYEPEDDSSPADSDKRMPAWKRMLKSFLMKHKATRWLGKKLFLAKKASGDFPSYLISKSDEDNIQNFPGRFEKFKDDLCFIRKLLSIRFHAGIRLSESAGEESSSGSYFFTPVSSVRSPRFAMPPRSATVFCSFIRGTSFWCMISPLL
jgi:hypothetical protein